MPEFFRKLNWLFHRRRKEDELREELQFHLDQEAAEQGVSPQEARRDLGNLTLLQEDTRSAWGWTLLEQLAQDLRYAFRTMGANKLFSLLAILSLALGIGANTAIYSFMDSILLRSLPVSDPESLVVLNWHAKQPAQWGRFVMHSINGSTYDDPKSGTTAGIFPYPAFELFQQNDSLFSSVFASCPAFGLNIAFKGQADLASGEYVSGDYFRGLAVSPAAGRLIVPDDDRAGASPIVVISFELSQRRFGGPANAAGQSILINDLPFTVAGVAPPGFFGVDPGAAPDVYLPMHANLSLAATDQNGAQADEYLDRNYYWIETMARLRPGVSLAQAQAALASQFQTWVASTAASDAERANLPAILIRPGAGGLDSLHRQYSQPLYVLLTLVGLILAIACANVANFLLARAAARRREIALRLSVGAGRFRVVRQLLTESVLLASIGGLLGVAFAIWGIRFLTLAAGQRGRAFYAARRIELARVERRARAFAGNGHAVRARACAPVHACRCDLRHEGNASRPASRAPSLLAHLPEPIADRRTDRRLAIDARRRWTLRPDSHQPPLHRTRIQSRESSPLLLGRPQGRS